MKRIAFTLAALVVSSVTSAALPPRYQNERDLDVLVSFVHSHPEVLESLRSIDFDRMQVRYGSDCVAQFGRGEVPPMPGPAPALRFESSTCPINAE